MDPEQHPLPDGGPNGCGMDGVRWSWPGAAAAAARRGANSRCVEIGAEAAPNIELLQEPRRRAVDCKESDNNRHQVRLTWWADRHAILSKAGDGARVSVGYETMNRKPQKGSSSRSPSKETSKDRSLGQAFLTCSDDGQANKRAWLGLVWFGLVLGETRIGR